jgi:hypothetical protein
MNLSRDLKSGMHSQSPIHFRPSNESVTLTCPPRTVGSACDASIRIPLSVDCSPISIIRGFESVRYKSKSESSLLESFGTFTRFLFGKADKKKLRKASFLLASYAVIAFKLRVLPLMLLFLFSWLCLNNTLYIRPYQTR